jgi:hypothetical protein
MRIVIAPRIRILITSFGRVSITIGNLWMMFDPVPNRFTDFGETHIYWKGKLIFFTMG